MTKVKLRIIKSSNPSEIKMPGKGFFGLDPMKILKGGLIGAGVGLVVGGGLTASKGLRSKREPESKELSVQTLNLDQAAPELIPLLVTLEGFVNLVPAEEQPQWREKTGEFIRNCDYMYNIILRVAKRQAVLDTSLIAEVEVRTRHASLLFDQLNRLIPAASNTGESPLEFTSVRKEIEDMLQATWLNFKNQL